MAIDSVMMILYYKKELAKLIKEFFYGNEM